MMRRKFIALLGSLPFVGSLFGRREQSPIDSGDVLVESIRKFAVMDEDAKRACLVELTAKLNADVKENDNIAVLGCIDGVSVTLMRDAEGCSPFYFLAVTVNAEVLALSRPTANELMWTGIFMCESEREKTLLAPLFQKLKSR